LRAAAHVAFLSSFRLQKRTRGAAPRSNNFFAGACTSLKKDSHSPLNCAGAKTSAPTARSCKLDFLYPSTQSAAGEGLVPAQLSGECLIFLTKRRRPQKTCLNGAQRSELFFAAETSLENCAFAAARSN